MEDENLKAFATAVLARAADVPEGDKFRFGRKVFIAALNPNKVTKKMLVAAHRAGLLELTRCDLTTAFQDRLDVVAASLTTYMHAEFHLVAPKL